MKNPAEDPLEVAMRQLAAEREQDLRELAQAGASANDLDLKAAFRRRMEGGRAPEVEERSLDEVETPARPSFRLVSPGWVAAALLLLVGGISWFQMIRTHEGGEAAGMDSGMGPGVGPAMGVSAVTVDGDPRIKVKTWEDGKLTLEVQRDGYDPEFFDLEVTVSTSQGILSGPEILSSSVHTIQIPESAIDGTEPVVIAVEIQEDGEEVGRWKSKVTLGLSAPD